MLTDTPRAPRLYLAGANTHALLPATEGRYALESFANIVPVVEAYRPLWRGALLDSGAFSVMTTGKAIDLGAYREYVSEHGDFYTAIASLDVIDGDWRQSIANWRAMPGTFPTWHEGEPAELLRDYLAEQAGGGWVGIGMQRPGGRLDPAQTRRVLATLPTDHDCHVHGWGLTMYAADYPFASTDSAAWIRMLAAHMANGNLRHLTKRELLEITIARLDRAPWRAKWDLNWSCSVAASTQQQSLL